MSAGANFLWLENPDPRISTYWPRFHGKASRALVEWWPFNNPRQQQSGFKPGSLFTATSPAHTVPSQNLEHRNFLRSGIQHWMDISWADCLWNESYRKWHRELHSVDVSHLPKNWSGHLLFSLVHASSPSARNTFLLIQFTVLHSNQVCHEMNQHYQQNGHGGIVFRF